MADPPSGPAGDTNQDGQRHTYEDEFIELLNAGPDTLSLAGWRLGDDDTALDKWFAFPSDARITPAGRVVLFGGGAPTGFTVPVFADDGRIGNGLSNSGDEIWLIDADGDTVDAVREVNWPQDQSLVRFPSVNDPFIEHGIASDLGAAFSPGQPLAHVGSPSEDATEPTISADLTTRSDPTADADPTARSDTLSITSTHSPPDTSSAVAPPAISTTDSTAVSISAPDTTGAAAIPLQEENDVLTAAPSPEPPPLVFIEEVLADPPSGPAGDANQDGQRHTYEDEFIELLNTGPDTLSLAGWRLGDDDTAVHKWFTFPSDARIAPAGRVVLFGGGAPTGFAVPVFVDDGRIGNGLSNSGDEIWLIDAHGDTIDAVREVNWPQDQSLVHFPSVNDPFVQHQTASDLGAAFSPGRALALVDSPSAADSDSAASTDTTSTAATSTPDTGTTIDTTTIPDPSSTIDSPSKTAAIPLPLPIIPRIAINEILADPPSGLAGDANRDGKRHTYEDEFVELYNAGGDTVSLTGWRLGDDDVDSSGYFHFPANVRLAPGAYLTVFGGGEPGDLPGIVFVDDGRIGNGLTNSGDQVVLLTANGDTSDAVFRDDWGNKRSAVRWPAGAGAFISHDAPPGTGDLFSPNRPRVVLTVLELLPASATLQAGDSLSLVLHAHYSDASDEIIDAGATWTLADTGHIILRHNTASFTKPGSTWLRATYLDVQSNILTVAVSTPPNRPPQFLSAPDTTARAGFSYSYQVETYDADDDTLYLALDRGPDWMHLATNTLDGLPPPDRHGPASVRLTLIDDEHTTYQEFVLHVLPRPDLIVSEILADPPGDANGDGDYDRYADEFIEIFNRGPELDLADWRLSDDDVSPSRQFRFPLGSTLPSGAYLVLFGGGRPQNIPGLVFVDDGRIGNGLTNGGDRLLLIAPDGPDTLIDLSYIGASNLNQSLISQEDMLFAAHGQLPGIGPFSPGRPRPTYTHFRIDSLDLTPAQNTGILNLFAYDGVDTVRIDPSLFTWQVMHETIISINKNGRTKALHPGTSQVEVRVGDALLATGTVRVQPPPDRPPEITSLPDTTVYAGGNYLYQVEATDPEGSIPIFRLIRAPRWLGVHPFNGHITGRAPDSSGAQVDIILGVDDSHGGLSQQRYNLHILPRPDMHITEVLADPPPGSAGDANGDGQRQTYADEFVEIFNAASTTVDLGGWYLSDADRHPRSQFHFPTGTYLPPHSYAVVFGGGKTRNSADLNDLFFAARGRIGDGLSNMQDEIYLIDPEGPDTLAWRTYALLREPNQSLHWPLDAPQPILHAAFPGRDPFSPGRPRPVLLGLRLVPSNARLIAGADLQLKLVGTFSDGGEQVLIAEPTWHSTDPAIATVDARGTVAAIDSGATAITAQLDTFAARAILLRVRHPLKQRLAFQPQWHRLSLAFGRELVFRVHSLQGENLRCRWSVNGRPQPGPDDRATFTYAPTCGDTISVRVENRNESATRQWIVAANLPPIIYPLQDTLAWIGKTYQTSIACSDPDDDPLLYTLVQAPAGMHLNAISGILEWMPTNSDSGSTPIRIDVLDGQNTATLICTLRVLTATAKSATPLSLLHNTPNPFNTTTTISFYLANVHATPTSIRIYNITGQPIYTLLEENLTTGWHERTWNGADATGNPAASGLYFCVLQHGPHRRIAKLLLLR